jgi:hypothetical protein
MIPASDSHVDARPRRASALRSGFEPGRFFVALKHEKSSGSASDFLSNQAAQK